MLRASLLASVAISPLIVTAALAEEYYDLGEIVLSGSLSPISRESTGSTVEVLTGDDVGANDSRVLDRLDRLPGVSSSSDGGLGQTSNIRIRGLSSKYIGVRINGIDVADPSQGQKSFNFGGLTGSGIERIEVLKGSQSALYGSEAIAGVIDIQTFRPTRLGFSSEMTVEGGSFGTYSGDLSLGYKNDTSEIAFTYGRITTDGIAAHSDNPEKDGFRQTTATLTAEHQVNDVLSFGGSVYFRRGTVEFDDFDGVTSKYTLEGINKFEERGARVYSELQTGVVKHTLSYSYFNIERKYPLEKVYAKNYDGTNEKIAYLGIAELSQAYTLNFGIDHTKEKASTDGVAHSNHTTSAQAELLIRPTDTLDISAALRYDDNSDFGGKTTGRLAAVWRPQDDLAFRTVIGTGFRAPTLYELYGPFGNLGLQPEESRSYEVGVEKSFGERASAKATLFYTEIDDLIDWDPATKGYNQIPGTTTSKGIELSGDYAITNAFKVYGNYTYTDAKGVNGRLLRTPRHDLVIGASNDFTDKLSAYVDLRHAAGFVPAAGNPKVGDYTLVGAGVSYDITDKATAYLRVENLFDEDYETADGYNQPGRAAYFGVRASF